MMKEFLKISIKFILFFLVFFIVVNVVFSAVIIWTDYDVRNRLDALKFEDVDYDYLTFGASTSFDGFDTGLMTEAGKRSYNLAIGGATIRANCIQLEEYLERCSSKPDTIIMGLNTELVQTLDDTIINPIIEVFMADHKFRIEDVPILKFKWLGFEFLKKIVSKKQRNAQLVLGQLKFQKTNTDYTSFKSKALNVKEFEESYWLGEFVKLCVDNHIQAIIIEMPGFKETQNVDEMGPYSLNFSNGYQGILYNMNNYEFCSIFDAEKDWIGNSHLNDRGAEKFTRELLKILDK